METTLKYNTIESLQRIPAWKEFIDNIVDDCDVVWDGNLINITETVENGRLVRTQKKLSDSQDVLQAKHATLSYINDVMHQNMLENISLKGLLRILSVYGCRIKDIGQNESALPHTFKVEGAKKDTAVYGFESEEVTDYDHETRGVKPESENPVIDDGDYDGEYEDGNVMTDYEDYLVDKNYEEEDTSFKYIYNIYGYNQKLPVLSTSTIRRVDDYYQFKINNNSDISGIMPKFIYVNKADISFDDHDNIESINTNYVYYSDDRTSESDGNSGIWLCNNSFLRKNVSGVELSREQVIDEYYTLQSEMAEKWVCETTTAFVFNDNDRVDLIKPDKRIKYNSVDYAIKEYDLRFALSDDSPIETATFTQTGRIGTKESLTPMQPVEVQYQYYVYEDSMYHNRWVIMDSVGKYFTITPSYLKSQLFADDCTLKVQPLFLYDNGLNVSMCANFIDTLGGENKISYEVEKFNTGEIKTRGVRTETNIEGEPVLLNDKTQEIDGVTVVSDNKPPVAESVSYGDWFYRWEQFNLDSTRFFKRDVYTPLDFNTAIPDENYNSYSLDNFFDGGRNTYPIPPSYEEVYANNVEKEIKPYRYENTFQQEFIETMYFNHFVKVSPIVDVETESPVSTTRLYCDNLELVAYGNIIPYIVSYDRLGELNTDEGSDETYNDLDCSIFSKIKSYNKHSHLITVNNPVWFENSHTPKYVVVAYQNASPFNHTNLLNITTERNDEVKPVVADLLNVFGNDKCQLNLFTKTEYDDYVADLQLEQERAVIDAEIERQLNNIALKNDPNKMLFGSYNARDDKNDTAITIEVTQNDSTTYTVTSVKKYGYFSFTMSGGYVNNAQGSYLVENIRKIRFTGGATLITSICFSDALNALSLGDGLFSDLKNIEVVSNYKPSRHSCYKLEGSEKTLYRLWDKMDFDKLTKLIYVNAEAFAAVTPIESNDYACPMLRKTKLKYFNFYDLEWNVSNTVIDFNLESFFEDCEYLETVNFRLKNGNRLRVTSLKNTFKGCRNLKYINMKDVDFSMLQTAQSALEGCVRLETVSVDWGTNYVITNINSMLKDCVKLNECGSFDLWKPTGAVDIRDAFANCGLKTVTLKNKFTAEYSSGVFDKCAAVSLNVNFDINPSRRLGGLDMPQLTDIVKIGNVLSETEWTVGSNTPFVLNTPNLSKSAFKVFIVKQSKTAYDEDETRFALLELHNNLFNKLKIGSDITDNGDGTYTMTAYPYIHVRPMTV